MEAGGKCKTARGHAPRRKGLGRRKKLNSVPRSSTVRQEAQEYALSSLNTLWRIPFVLSLSKRNGRPITAPVRPRIRYGAGSEHVEGQIHANRHNCEKNLGSVDVQFHSERKRRTGFVDFVTEADFVKDAEAQAFVGDCLLFSAQSGRANSRQRRYLLMRSPTTSSSAIRRRFKMDSAPPHGGEFSREWR